MKSSFWIVPLFIWTACATGPKPEHKHALNVLNGENYDVGPTGPPLTAGGIPIATGRKVRQSRIDGRVEITDAMAGVPLRFVTIALIDAEKKSIARTATDSEGRFRLVGDFVNGSYEIKLLSEKYVGGQFVTIKDYETGGLLITAQRRE